MISFLTLRRGGDSREKQKLLASLQLVEERSKEEGKESRRENFFGVLKYAAAMEGVHGLYVAVLFAISSVVGADLHAGM